MFLEYRILITSICVYMARVVRSAKDTTSYETTQFKNEKKKQNKRSLLYQQYVITVFTAVISRVINIDLYL